MRVSTNVRRACIRLALAGTGLLATTISFSAQAYDLRIANRTTLVMEGQVNYAACKADRYMAAPGQTWSTNGRGMCLIRSIEARVRPTAAAPERPTVITYSSPGTNFADFVIAQSGTSFRVWSKPELEKEGLSVPDGAKGPVFRWQAVADKEAPPAAAFKGGSQQFGGRSQVDLLPVCRGEINGALALGNAAPFYSHSGGWSWSVQRCYVFLNGRENELANYEVLMVDPEIMVRNPKAVKWVPATGGAIPPGALNGAKSGAALQVCRAQNAETENVLRVGTMGANGCYMPYGGQNRFAANYDVLVIEGAATQQLSRGPNEPRLAAAPDRPARVAGPGEDCVRVSGRCKARLDELREMGAYKINSVIISNFSGNTMTRFKKAQGNIWDMVEETGRYNNVPLKAERPYLEVERTDNQIVLYSSEWDLGDPWGKVGPSTIIFAVDGGAVNVAGGSGATAQVREGTITWAGTPSRGPGGAWIVPTSAQNIQRAMMAEPDTALSLTLQPINGQQKTTFWKGGSPVTLIKNGDQFGAYKIASSGDGWLELYTVSTPGMFDGRTWRVHFLTVDFQRNRVWELLGETDRAPGVQDVAALRELARSAGPSNAWAEAYQLTSATVFSGKDIGSALGRVNGAQVAWTLREQAGNVIRWEELKSSGAAAKAGVADGAPVGRLITETGRTDRSVTFSGSEYGGSVTIDWVSGQISNGNAKIGDFLSGSTEYVGQRKKLPAPTPPGISPGFQFVNKTDWPVMVKINQVGCLYHGVVKPHTTMTRNTGAVWFTLAASWSDGQEMTQEKINNECIAPVGLTVVGVIISAASGGSATGVVALAAASAAATGAATTAVAFMNASGASQGEQDLVAAGIYVVAAAATGGAGAFQVVKSKAVAGATTMALRQQLAVAAAKGAAKEALTTIKDEAINYALSAAPGYLHPPDEREVATLESWFTSEITLAGQYAGYPWPWKMKDRVMPQYEITGGPRVDDLRDGSKLIRKGSPFKIVRVN